jgi:hypothetical protein
MEATCGFHAHDVDFNYRFMGEEGWIVGKPAILLYASTIIIVVIIILLLLYHRHHC